MPVHLTLSEVRLTYAGGLVLHTATSGAVAELQELRLMMTEGERLLGIGASRINIAYLSGISADALREIVLATAPALDWRPAGADFVTQLDARFPSLPAPARMLFEMWAVDRAARAQGIPLAQALSGLAPETIPTNQTLFRSDDATLLARAEAYVRRGFTDLKLRVGFGSFAEDLAQLQLLRNRFGTAIRLSVDVNGQWSETQAAKNIGALAPLRLAYVEQPIAAGDWDALARVAQASPLPIMLDESLSSSDAVSTLIARRLPVLAHLKLAKLGGLDRLIACARALAAAGIPVMVGQMNEGVISTLAAAHAAAVLAAPYCELYGADGLANDPAGHLAYHAGQLALPQGPGLGPLPHAPHGRLLWEYQL